MIKNYTLQDKSEFKTITIPKGTVLFHGLTVDKKTDHNNIERSNIKELFYNNYGFPNDKGYAIEPTRNVFFYPVPYVASTVDLFNIHVMYLTNYDLELLLMINPSKIDRDSSTNNTNPLRLVQICDTILKEDMHGFEMSDYDPCFTKYCMKNFKNIDGYIAIADTDQKRFKMLYKDLFKKEEFNKLLHILPSIVKNSKKRSGIPEIVIHPFHRRREECFYVPRRGYTIEKIIKYSINNRAEYNYFPLLFYTNVGIYHITDLTKKNLISIEENSISRNIIETIDIIYLLIEKSLKHFLSSEGVLIKKIKYNMTIDVRTGFYILEKKKLPDDIMIEDNIHITDLDEEEDTKHDIEINKYKVPIIYPLKNKEFIMSLIGRNNNPFTNYNWSLSHNGMSLKNIYVLNKGDKTTYDKAYSIEDVLTRLDIQNYSLNTKVSIRKNFKTRKNRHD